MNYILYLQGGNFFQRTYHGLMNALGVSDNSVIAHPMRAIRQLKKDKDTKEETDVNDEPQKEEEKEVEFEQKVKPLDVSTILPKYSESVRDKLDDFARDDGDIDESLLNALKNLNKNSSGVDDYDRMMAYREYTSSPRIYTYGGMTQDEFYKRYYELDDLYAKFLNENPDIEYEDPRLDEIRSQIDKHMDKMNISKDDVSYRLGSAKYNQNDKRAAYNTSLDPSIYPTVNNYITDRILETVNEGLLRSYNRLLPYSPVFYDTGDLGLSCMPTASSNLGGDLIYSTVELDNNYNKHGFVPVSLDELSPGDFVTWGEHHTGIYTNTDNYGQIRANYADGGGGPLSLKFNAYYGSNPDHGYRFVGTPQDSIRWTNEYNNSRPTTIKK